MKKRYLKLFLAAILITVSIFHFNVVPTLAAGSLPCDIYAAGGTPCVAAHSTTRALFSAYNGKLYQVQRASDQAMTDIVTLTAGGYANSAAQDSFCAGTSCIITIIYDQTTNHNDLPIEGPGDAGPQNHGANASIMKLSAGGHTVYGMWSDGQTGYRNNAAVGTATGSQPDGMYSVFSGTHYNNLCCFDYGNTEKVNKDTGNGHMHAIYFGAATWFQPSGPGPAWVGSDLENGMFWGGNGCNPNNTGINASFVTAMSKNDGVSTYAIRGGNATSGSLITWYNGSLPTQGGYIPMSKEGGIVLGTGGDNSNGSTGAWMEGAMTFGYPSDATENAVQANIVSVGYTLVSAPQLTATPPVIPSATPATLSGLVKINAGGPATGSFQGDGDYDMGTVSGTGNAIDINGVTNAAPMAVYQTERWFGCTMTYTVPGLTANAPYTVRLHFAETFFTAPGQRVFNVAINGTQVLTDFDIVAAAGAANKAVVRDFSANANASGKIAVAFLVGKANNPKVNGIEILAGTGSVPTNTPAQPTATLTPGGNGSPWNGTPAPIPGTVEAENYNTGGEGVAYHDNEAANQGNQYRTTDGVDVETTGDTGGAYNVGWTNAAEWMKYTVNVTSAGTYNINFRVASPNTGSAFHLEVDGTNVTGTMTIPNTGGWQTYQTITKTGVSLSAGQHVLRFYEESGGYNFNWFSVSSGTFTAIPTATQATGTVVKAINAGGAATGSYVADTNFDSGSQFSDTSTAIDTTGDPNPAPQGVYQTVRWNTAFTYTIPGLTAGATYTVRLHWAELTWQTAGSRKFNVAINGTSVLSAFDVFSAAGGFKKAVARSFTTTANGSGQIAIAFSQGGADNPFISGIEIVSSSGQVPTNTSIAPTNTATRTNTPVPSNTPVAATATSTPGGNGSPWNGTPAPIPGTVEAENYNTGGEGVAYHDNEAANQGNQYRTTDGVDVETTGDTSGAYNVGWTNAAEWMKYTVNVTTAGTYNINFRVATPNAGSVFHLEVDGTNVTGTITIPNTGGWQTYQTITKTGVSLSAGQHVLRFYEESGGFNFNWFSVSSGTSATATATRTNTPQPTATQTTGTVVKAINAGGTTTGSYVADTNFDSGNQFSDTSTAIDTSSDPNPAPQSVYQTVRWNTAFTYTIPGLTAGATYTVRLQWAELTWQTAGSRKFNVAINGASVLSAFDVFAAAGGFKKAVARSFTTTANGSGQIAIAFSQGGADNPFISGIEIVSGAGTPPTATPVPPTATPVATGTPVTPAVIGNTIVGYQGWFAAAGDGSTFNSWFHWSNSGVPAPGNLKFELYPDVREYTTLFQTNFANLGNGSPARLFSSYTTQTIDLHFQWMKANNIDGAALQRFGTDVLNPSMKSFRDSVSTKLRNAAEANGRTFYIMYDISGMGPSFVTDIENDWTNTIVPMNLTGSPMYARQGGKPVVCIWGIGFNDRVGTPTDWTNLINWFKGQGLYVIGGAPADWRTSGQDLKPGFENVWPLLNMIQPWTVGRYGTDADVDNYKNNFLIPDRDYAIQHGIDYQPVAFPGFAWSNWNGGTRNQIPRRQGNLFWRQVFNIKSANISTLYIAMFDEYDEGTAIAKAAEDTSMIPTNQYFLTLDADGTHLSSDFYLRLAGAANKMLKGQAPLSLTIPIPNQ